MNRLLYLFPFILIAALSSCTDALTPKEYAQWVENPDHGLSITKKEKNYQFTLAYKPIEYLVALQQRQEQLPAELLEKEMKKMKDMQYYTLKLSTTTGKPVFSGDALHFPEKEIYLLSGIQKDMVLLEGTDSLPCRIFHFEGANGFLPYDNCVLAFDKTANIQKDKTFLYKADKLGMDWIKIIIKADDINKLPKLKTI